VSVSVSVSVSVREILRLTIPRLKSTPGAPFAQDDSFEGRAPDQFAS
jgi:hypothetical protein